MTDCKDVTIGGSMVIAQQCKPPAGHSVLGEPMAMLSLVLVLGMLIAVIRQDKNLNKTKDIDS